MLRLETPGTKTVEDFLNGSENQCESTAKEYRKRLELFAKFVQEIIDKFKVKHKQLEDAANEIHREREKDNERTRLGLTIEEYESTLMETEDPNGVA